MTPNERQVMGLDDFTAADLQAIKQAELPVEAVVFDSEMAAASLVESQRRDNIRSE